MREAHAHRRRVAERAVEDLERRVVAWGQLASSSSSAAEELGHALEEAGKAVSEIGSLIQQMDDIELGEIEKEKERTEARQRKKAVVANLEGTLLPMLKQTHRELSEACQVRGASSRPPAPPTASAEIDSDED